jgi:hypothetical protein
MMDLAETSSLMDLQRVHLMMPAGSIGADKMKKKDMVKEKGTVKVWNQTTIITHQLPIILNIDTTPHSHHQADILLHYH